MTMSLELRPGSETLRPFAVRWTGQPGVRHASAAALSRILIVDDNKDLCHLLAEYLQEQGFEAVSAQGRAEMEAALAAEPPALILLDLRLGVDAGLDILRDLRSRSQIPVIIITGHGRDEVDRVVGLELGADDYLTKPFSCRELLARIRTVLRRSDAVIDSAEERAASDKVAFEGWVLDRRRRRLTNPTNEVVSLTRGEYSLLSAFLDAPGRPLSREFLLQVTRVHEDVFDRSIDVQILRLRRKLEADPTRPRLIRTERGLGYVFSADVTRESKQLSRVYGGAHLERRVA